MPIPVAKIREAQRPLEEQIYAFLAEHPDDAYRPEEVYEAIKGEPVPSGATLRATVSAERAALFDTWARAFRCLLDAGRVEVAAHEDKIYFYVPVRE